MFLTEYEVLLGVKTLIKI